MSSKIQPDDMARSYAQRYSSQGPAHLYPVEFVVRALLGTYPKHRLDRQEIAGKRVLDLGCGDGRNLGLLCRLGLEVHGVEIAESIVAVVQRNLDHHHLSATLAVGTNAHIPYPDACFDYLLACHSCYYVEEGTSFRDNLLEMRRVLRPGGMLIASLPMPGTHLLTSAQPLADGHCRVTQDVYGVRKGIIIRCFQDAREIEDVFSPHFSDFRIGFTDDEYWGLRQRVWILICRARDCPGT
jgi:SAM-dependent methyltransferase